MACHLQLRWGDCIPNPTIEDMRRALAELDRKDPEHPDTWLSDGSGWTLAAYESGRLVWENAEGSGEPRHMMDVPTERVLELWQILARGDLDAIESQPWQPGYGPVATGKLEPR